MDLRGTPELLRLSLRRDRIRLPLIAVSCGLMAGASYGATVGMYPSVTERVAAAEIFNAAPSLVAMFGRVYDPTSAGALATIKLIAFYSALIGVIAVFHAVRHTRADEAAGRSELLHAAPTGRLAPLAAAALNGLLLALGITLATTVALLATGAPAAGSIGFGLAWGGTAAVFGATALAVAQVANEPRSAIGIGVAAVGVAYGLRAAGDLAGVEPGPASWLSPIGWAQQIRPFAGDRIWVAGLAVVASLVMVTAALTLRTRRDLGAGLLPHRHRTVVTTISSPLALTFRLQRGLVIGWLCGAAVFGAVVGSITSSVDGFLTSPEVQKWMALLGGAADLRDMFLAAELSVLSLIIAGLGVALVDHERKSEESGLTGLLQAAGVPRGSFVGATITLAAAATAVTLVVAGVSIGLAASASTGDALTGPLAVAAVAHLPAVWDVAMLAVAVYGWRPRLVPAVYGFLVVCSVGGEFGALWHVPQWALDLSPFTHSPDLPGGTVSWLALGAQLAAAVALAALGAWGLRRRDLVA